MKTRQGFVSNSSSSSFVCVGCKLTPAIKAKLKKEYPKQKSEYDGRMEDEWEWLERVTCEILDLNLVDLDGKYILGMELADCGNYMEDAEYTVAEIQKEVQQLKKIIGNVPVKLYMGTRPD